MAIADSHSLPLAIRVTGVSPNESTRVEATLAERNAALLPKRLIEDKAYNSATLDERLRQDQGIEFIAPQQPQKRQQIRWVGTSSQPPALEDRTAICLVEKIPGASLGAESATPQTSSAWSNRDAC